MSSAGEMISVLPLSRAVRDGNGIDLLIEIVNLLAQEFLPVSSHWCAAAAIRNNVFEQ